jgi:hypothetical protein
LHTPVKDATGLTELLQAYSGEEMTANAVGLGVNNPKFEGPACVEPLPHAKT